MCVSPLQLVNLHRSRRYFFRHKTSHMVLSIIFLEDKHNILLHLSIFYEYQQFFQHRICFSIQPPDYSDPWLRLARSSSFFLIMLFNNMKYWHPHLPFGQHISVSTLVIYIINAITNWRVSLSRICHSWPNNVVTHSCAARNRELLRYLVIRDIFLIMKLVN